MGKTDNSRRGHWQRSGAVQVLRKLYNRNMRAKARSALRNGREPVPDQHRHSALWDAS